MPGRGVRPALLTSEAGGPAALEALPTEARADHFAVGTVRDKEWA